MKSFKLLVFSLILAGQLASAPVNTAQASAKPGLTPVVLLYERRDVLQGVHPFICGLYKNALEKDGAYFVFLHATSSGRYFRQKQQTGPGGPPPDGVSTAFPLGLRGAKAMWVITGETFSAPLGAVTVLHPFGFQENMAARQNCPKTSILPNQRPHRPKTSGTFPFHRVRVKETYQRLVFALRCGDEEAIWLNRQALKQMLSPYHLRCLQQLERKGGLALFAANKLKEQMGLIPECLSSGKMFGVSSVFAGGEASIKHLLAKKSWLTGDIKALVANMWPDNYFSTLV